MHDNVQSHPGGDRGGAGEGARDYYSYHDPDGDARLTTTLVHALADVMGVDVTDTGFVLADHIDPDALDTLFADPVDERGNPLGHVAFAVDSYRVTIYSDGTIVITPPSDAPSEPSEP